MRAVFTTNIYYYGIAPLDIQFFKDSLLVLPLLLQSSILWSWVFVFVTQRVEDVYSYSGYSFFYKYRNYFYRRLAAIHFFNVTDFFSDVKTSNQLPWNKLLIKIATYTEQHRLYWIESSHLFEQATFLHK